MLDRPDLPSYGDNRLAGTAPTPGDMSDPPISVNLVTSGLGPPELEVRDKLTLLDFSSDIDPGPGGIWDELSSADNLAKGSKIPGQEYVEAVWMKDLLHIRKEAPEVPLRELTVCQSDMLNFAGTLDPDLGLPYPRPEDIIDLPDSSSQFQAVIGKICVGTSVKPSEARIGDGDGDNGRWDSAIDRCISLKSKI